MSLRHDIDNAVTAMRDAADTLEALSDLLFRAGEDIPEHDRDVALMQRLENAARKLEGASRDIR